MKRKRKSKRKPLRFSKIVISGVLVYVALFTIGMSVTYWFTGGVPDTLVTCVFAFAGGEAGVLGFIKHGERKKDKTESENVDETEAVG